MQDSNIIYNSSYTLDFGIFENAISVILAYFKKEKDNYVANENYHKSKIITNSSSPNDGDESLNLFFSEMDILISNFRNNKKTAEESYILIRIKDMVHAIFTNKDFNVKSAELLIDILESYQSFNGKRIEMKKEDFSNYPQIFGEFKDNFSEKECEFYGLLDSHEISYEKSIQKTYDVLWEIK